MLKKRKKIPAYRKPAFWVTALIAVGVCLLGWWFLKGPHATRPRFDFLLASVNQEPKRMLPEQTLTLHPEDRVKVLDISTNIPLNLGVRLSAKELDADALRYEEMKIKALLPDQDIFKHYRIRVQIKHRTKVLGYVDWQVRPHVEDWLDRANRIINRQKRLELLERAARLMPAEKQIRERLLKEYKTAGLRKPAAVLLEKLVKENPSRQLLYELLEVYRAMPSADGVISVLNRLIQLDPEDVKVRFRLAKVLEAQGKLKPAVMVYQAVLDRTDKADRLPLYKHLGYLCTETGQVKAALGYYLKAANLDRKDANLFYNLSYLYEREGQSKKADLYLAKALQLKPGDTEGRLRLAKRLMVKGELKRAKTYLEELLASDPKSVKALLLMAQIAEKQKKKRDLGRIYKKILELDPKNETVIYNLGVLEYEAGNFDAAMGHFRNYLKRHPNEVGVHEIVFNILGKRGSKKEAFEEALTLIRLVPKRTEPYQFVFEYLKDKRDYGMIIKVMEKGLKAGAKDAFLRECLLLAYLETGKEKPAMQQIKEILKIRPKDISLWLHLANLQEKHGDLGGALTSYKQVLDLSPEHEVAGEAYLRLRLRGVHGQGSQ